MLALKRNEFWSYPYNYKFSSIFNRYNSDCWTAFNTSTTVCIIKLHRNLNVQILTDIYSTDNTRQILSMQKSRVLSPEKCRHSWNFQRHLHNSEDTFMPEWQHHSHSLLCIYMKKSFIHLFFFFSTTCTVYSPILQEVLFKLHYLHDIFFNLAM